MKKSQLATISIITALILLFFYKGYYTTKVFGYEFAACNVGFGEVGAALDENYSMQGRTELGGAPYTLVVYSESRTDGEISILSVELVEAQSGKQVFSDNQKRTETLEREDRNCYSMTFIWDALELPHQDYRLNMKIEFKNAEGVIDKNIELPLNTEYREYHGNKYWDRMASI